MAESAEKEPARPVKKSAARRILRRLVKVLAWILGVLLGLLVLAWLALLIFFPDDKIRSMLVDELSDRLGVAVAAGSLDLEIFSGLVLENVRIGAPAGFEAPPFEAERLIVDYSLADIFDKKLRVKNVRLEGASIRIEERAGRTNVEALTAGMKHEEKQAEAADDDGEKGEPGFILDLDQVDVSGARLLFAHGDLRADLQGLDIRIAGRLSGAGRTRLEARLSLDPAGRPNLWLATPGASSKAMSAAVGFSLSAGLFGSGHLEISGSITAEELKPFMAEYGLGKLEIGFEGAVELGSAMANLSSLEITEGGRPLARAEGRVDYAEGPGRARLEIGDLTPRQELLGAVLARLVPGLQQSGRVRVTSLVAEGPLDGTLPRFEAAIVLDAVKLAAGDLRLFPLSGEFKLGLEPREDGGDLTVGAVLGAGTARAKSLAVQEVRLSVDGAGRLASSAGGWEFSDATLGIEVRAARLGDGKMKAHMPGAKADLKLARLAFDPGGGWSADLAGRTNLTARRVGAPGLVLNRPAVAVDSNGRLGSADRRSRLGVVIDLRAGPSMLGPVSLKGVRGKLATGLGRGLAAVGIEFNARATGLELDAELLPGSGASSTAGEVPGFSIPDDLVVDCAAVFAPGPKSLRLERLSLVSGERLKLSVSGDLDLARYTMRLSAAATVPDLSGLAAALPHGLKTDLPHLGGQIDAQAKIAGPIPSGSARLKDLPLDTELSLVLKRVAFDFPESGLASEGISGSIDLARAAARPDEIKSRARLSASRLALEGTGLDLREVGVDLEAGMQRGELSLRGDLRAARVPTAGLLSGPLKNVSLAFDSRLLGTKDLRLGSLRLKLPSLGLSVELSGRLARRPGKDWLTGLRVSSRLGISFESKDPVLWPGGFTTRGSARVELAVESAGDGLAETTGKMSFFGLDLTSGGFGLQGLEGGIPTRQAIAFSPRPSLLARAAGKENDESGAEPSQAYDEALRHLKGKERTFSMRRVKVEDLEFDTVSANLELDAGRLQLGSLRFSFLGGDVLADAVLEFAGHRRFSLDSEMSGVDLSKLGAFSLAGSSDISGNSHLVVDWTDKTFSAEVNLTRIGRSMLQALLVAVDPAETNPGVLRLRGFLDKYDVSPKRVSLILRRGLLDMEVVLQMGVGARAASRFIKGFKGDKFPIRHLKIGGLLDRYLGF